jgi:hypothetical protein
MGSFTEQLDSASGQSDRQKIKKPVFSDIS